MVFKFVLPPGLCEGPSSRSIGLSGEVLLCLFWGMMLLRLVLPPDLCEGPSTLLLGSLLLEHGLQIRAAAGPV